MYLSKINCTDYLKESDYHKRIIISNNLLKENMKYDVEAFEKIRRIILSELIKQ